MTGGLSSSPQQHLIAGQVDINLIFYDIFGGHRKNNFEFRVLVLKKFGKQAHITRLWIQHEVLLLNLARNEAVQFALRNQIFTQQGFVFFIKLKKVGFTKGLLGR